MLSETNCLHPEELKLKFKEKKEKKSTSFAGMLTLSSLFSFLALLPLIPMFPCTCFARILTEHQLKQADEKICAFSKIKLSHVPIQLQLGSLKNTQQQRLYI